MSTVETICADLRRLDGVIGAFVWQAGRCLGSTLPVQYDPTRVLQVGNGLRRLISLAQTAGHQASPSILRWQQMSLFAWPLRGDALLAVLTSPTTPSVALDPSVNLALEGLDDLLQSLPTGNGS